MTTDRDVIAVIGNQRIRTNMRVIAHYPNNHHRPTIQPINPEETVNDTQAPLDRTMEQIEADFRKLVRHHDLTYAMSDDHNVWRRGSEAYRKIQAEAELLPRELAVKIWNENVAAHIRAESRSMFEWTADYPVPLSKQPNNKVIEV